MATVTKDFKIKYGLIVEGSVATVAGNSILTKSQDDQNYIIGLIGGSATSNNTPDTVVLRDEDGSFSAEVITADGGFIGDVTGTVSDISNHNTDSLSEGLTNKYYTDGRVKDVLTGATKTNISITTIDGELHITAENGVGDSTTDNLTEGTTNKYFTDSRARDAISAGNGINYDNTTGTISADLGDFDTDDLIEGTNKYYSDSLVDSHLSGGDGINYSSGTISADLGTGLEISSGSIAINRTTVDGWYDVNGAASDVQDNLDTHTGSSSAHGVTGDIVGTSDTQNLSNKTITDSLHFKDGANDYSAIHADTNNLAIDGSNNITLTTNTGDIVLNPDGAAYIISASAGNEIATHGYVDNAVSGLAWKQAVNLLANVDVNMTGSTGTLVVDSHSALTSADAGYRILLTNQTVDSENGIYEYTELAGVYTLVRTSDSDTYQELIGAAVYVMEGTQFGATSWVQGDHYIESFADQIWTQFSGSGSVTAGTGITVNGLEVSVDRTTVDGWYEASGVVLTHAGLTSTHGVSGDIVGTSDEQTLTNKTIDGGDNTLQNIPNSALDNDSITINGSATALGSSVTLDTDDVSEGTAKYFTDSRARQSLSGGTAISYDNTTGEIAVDASQLDTGDISEGTNKYYTDSRVKSVLTGSTQTNISITEVAGELIITAENGVADSTTDNLVEGTSNHYFTDERAQDAVGNSVGTGLSYDDASGAISVNTSTIATTDYVNGLTTDDIAEGDKLYFTDQRAVDALEAVVPNFTEVDINTVATQVATTTNVATTSTVTAYQFAHADYRSAKFLVKAQTSSHTELSEILVTLDSLNNVAITEYAEITSNGNLFNVTADVDGANVRVRVTTTHNDTDVTVFGTLLA